MSQSLSSVQTGTSQLRSLLAPERHSDPRSAGSGVGECALPPEITCGWWDSPGATEEFSRGPPTRDPYRPAENQSRVLQHRWERPGRVWAGLTCRLCSRPSTQALIRLSRCLRECSSSTVGTVGRRAQIGVHPGHRGCGQCCQSCPPSSTLGQPARWGALSRFVSCGSQVAVPGDLDCNVPVGPLDLDRHMVGEQGNPLVFMHPPRTGTRESGRCVAP